MSDKLVFIMSDSEAYLRDEAIRLYTSWGFTSSNVKQVEKWDPSLVRNSLSLFGDVSMVHLDLSDKARLKEFVEFISDKKEKHNFEGDNWFGPGLIITSIHAQGSKKVENLVTKSGGKVYKKAKPAEMRKVLLNRINLSKETRAFAETYVGEDYQMLISVINQLEKMSKERQLALTPEELIVSLPTKPGSVPPWDFVNPMLAGDAKKSIDLFERAMTGSHILVAMVLARKKLQMVYRLKVLQMDGVRNANEQAKILGENSSWAIRDASNTASKISLGTSQYLAKLALVTEADLKGHSSADPHLIFTNFIAAACLAIKHNADMPLEIR